MGASKECEKCVIKYCNHGYGFKDCEDNKKIYQQGKADGIKDFAIFITKLKYPHLADGIVNVRVESLIRQFEGGEQNES